MTKPTMAGIAASEAELKHQLMSVLRDNDLVFTKDIVRQLKPLEFTKRDINRQLYQLEKDGIVEKVSVSPGSDSAPAWRLKRKGGATNVMGHLDCQESREECYVMKSRPRGLMLIINNEDFDGCGKETRHGTNKDRDGLKAMFQQFGFQVECENNRTKEEMLKDIKLYAQTANDSNYDSVVIAVLSHGDESIFFGVDGKAMMESELTDPFNGHNCERLIGKPKLFILQVCRGDKRRQSVSHDGPKNPSSSFVIKEGAAEDQPKISPEEDENLLKELARLKITKNRHPDADMVLAYSTLPGHLSMRDNDNGSWFIQSIIEVFSKHAHNTEMLALLRMVNYQMSTKMEKWNAQIPQPRFTTLKEWYLNPVQD